MPTGRGVFKACRACRRKRARCEGEQPCQRCHQWNIECVYDKRSGETKERLRSERSELQRRERATAVVLEALASGENAVPLLERLWNKESVIDIAAMISNLGGHPGANSGTKQLTGPSSTTGDGSSDALDLRRRDSAASASASASVPIPSSSAPTQSRPAGSGPDPLATSDDGYSDGSLYSGSIQLPALRPEDHSLSGDSSGYALSEPGRNFIGDPVGPPVSLPSDTHLSSDMVVLPRKLACNLIEAFFSKQHVPFPIIKRELFMQDFVSGKHTYCSTALVHSICCLACRLETDYGHRESYYTSLAATLFGEAASLLKSNPSHYSLPDVKALGLLSLYQLGLGEYLDARMLAEESVRRVDLHHRRSSDAGTGDASYQSTRANALFGAISLARMVRLATDCFFDPGQKLKDEGKTFFSTISSNQTGTIDVHVEQLLSVPSMIHTNWSSQKSPSTMLQLTDWVYCFSRRLHATDGNKIPNYLRDTYLACLSWYDSTMGSVGSHGEPSPFVHLFYHFCLLVLFRPVINMRYTDSDISAVDICIESADALLTLAKLCHEMGEQKFSSFVPVFIHVGGLTSLDVANNDGRAVKDAEGEKRTRIGLSLLERAIDLLLVLGEVYPSAQKCRRELQDKLNLREQGEEQDHSRSARSHQKVPLLIRNSPHSSKNR